MLAYLNELGIILLGMAFTLFGLLVLNDDFTKKDKQRIIGFIVCYAVIGAGILWFTGGWKIQVRHFNY